MKRYISTLTPSLSHPNIKRYMSTLTLIAFTTKYDRLWRWVHWPPLYKGDQLHAFSLVHMVESSMERRFSSIESILRLWHHSMPLVPSNGIDRESRARKSTWKPVLCPKLTCVLKQNDATIKTIYTAAFTLPLIMSFGQIIVFKGLQRKINDIAETIQLHTLNEP